MPGYYTPLPGAEIKNALIDYAPINNGLETLRDQRNTNRNALMQQRQLDNADKRLTMDQEAHAQNMKTSGLDYQTKLAQRSAGVAQMAMGEKDPARKAAIIERMYSMHPDYKNNLISAGVDPNDHDGVANFVIAQARGYVDPLEQQAKNLKIQAAQNEIGMNGLNRQKLQAEIKALEQKTEDPIGQLLAERMRGMNKPQQPVTPQSPMLQPQSFDGQGIMPGGVQLIADQPMAQQQAAPSAPDSNSIDTVFGTMSREEARALAGPMLLNPKYATAGKAILDALDKSGSELSKPAATQLDERTISAASTLGRLQEIKKQFKPEFQQIPERLKLMGASWGAAMGAKVNPQMQKQLSDFASYKATAFDNFNQLLKELSGTAVSASELSRQKIVQPNPGEGLLDGDDPVTFMSKVQQGEKIAKSAMARMNYMRSRGIQFNKDTAEQFMRLEDVPAAIDKRGAQIEQQIRQANPQADPMSIERETAKRLKQEFGI